MGKMSEDVGLDQLGGRGTSTANQWWKGTLSTSSFPRASRCGLGWAATDLADTEVPLSQTETKEGTLEKAAGPGMRIKGEGDSQTLRTVCFSRRLILKVNAEMAQDGQAGTALGGCEPMADADLFRFLPCDIHPFFTTEYHLTTSPPLSRQLRLTMSTEYGVLETQGFTAHHVGSPTLTTSFFQSRISTNRTLGLHDGWMALSKTWPHGKFLQFGVPAGGKCVARPAGDPASSVVVLETKKKANAEMRSNTFGEGYAIWKSEIRSAETPLADPRLRFCWSSLVPNTILPRAWQGECQLLHTTCPTGIAAVAANPRVAYPWPAYLLDVSLSWQPHHSRKRDATWSSVSPNNFACSYRTPASRSVVQHGEGTPIQLGYSTHYYQRGAMGLVSAATHAGGMAGTPCASSLFQLVTFARLWDSGFIARHIRLQLVPNQPVLAVKRTSLWVIIPDSKAPAMCRDVHNRLQHRRSIVEQNVIDDHSEVVRKRCLETTPPAIWPELHASWHGTESAINKDQFLDTLGCLPPGPNDEEAPISTVYLSHSRHFRTMRCAALLTAPLTLQQPFAEFPAVQATRRQAEHRPSSTSFSTACPKTKLAGSRIRQQLPLLIARNRSTFSFTIALHHSFIYNAGAGQQLPPPSKRKLGVTACVVLAIHRDLDHGIIPARIGEEGASLTEDKARRGELLYLGIPNCAFSCYLKVPYGNITSRSSLGVRRVRASRPSVPAPFHSHVPPSELARLRDSIRYFPLLPLFAP
ncbi:uncharacterized protein CLUP02_09135 [Colletotrichum lupini]|uniref:Uncharacterized protein n=1 Tax=Colletotrichum lupini TaxID=145971 RepID=A0A9Q8SUC9_9PEZI|nr:uncharacterized protein CLUP02_09135 [Colletotrichum lupini]UQC83640.1 hypothetical protein CLUP02_09135 [Colletotrichum lupini]